MTTTKEIQEAILSQTGIKVSVSKGTGSMKGYFYFRPMSQNGTYPEFPYEWRNEFRASFPQWANKEPFANGTQIAIYGFQVEDNRLEFKKETKPVDREQMSVKTWGNKNSQVRLDKACQRNAKRILTGNVAKY